VNNLKEEAELRAQNEIKQTKQAVQKTQKARKP
jgi:hypothetical protein